MPYGNPIFFDMFAGIGASGQAWRLSAGLNALVTVRSTNAQSMAYCAIYDTEGEYYCDDARTINPDEMPDFDLLCAGFPCQSYPEEKNIPKFQREPLKCKGLSAKTSG